MPKPVMKLFSRLLPTAKKRLTTGPLQWLKQAVRWCRSLKHSGLAIMDSYLPTPMVINLLYSICSIIRIDIYGRIKEQQQWFPCLLCRTYYQVNGKGNYDGIECKRNKAMQQYKSPD